MTRFWRVVVRCIHPCASRRLPLGRVLKVVTCFLFFPFLFSSLSKLSSFFLFFLIVGRGLRVSRGRAIRKRPW